MSCEATLAWYDNVPLVSWLVLRGRCRHCSSAISWRYPAVEGLTALLIAGCALKFGCTWDCRDRLGLLRRAGRGLGDRLRAPDHPEPRRRFPPHVVVLVAQHGRASVGRMADRRRSRRERVPAPRRARLSGRHGHGRRQARPAARRRARPHRSGRADDRHGLRARAVGRGCSRSTAAPPGRCASRSGRSSRSAVSSRSLPGRPSSTPTSGSANGGRDGFQPGRPPA